MGGAYSIHKQDEKCISHLVRKPQEKRSLGTPRYR
jgi:hypothetical protein